MQRELFGSCAELTLFITSNFISDFYKKVLVIVVIIFFYNIKFKR
jgi:hypothetical protein